MFKWIRKNKLYCFLLIMGLLPIVVWIEELWSMVILNEGKWGCEAYGLAYETRWTYGASISLWIMFFLLPWAFSFLAYACKRPRLANWLLIPSFLFTMFIISLLLYWSIIILNN